MAIPEDQLTIWAKQGSVTQSSQTYETIRNALDDVNAPYHGRDYSIFLQGSYGNHTNVYRDSDVDIIIRLDETFYSDLNALDEGAKTSFDKNYPDVPYGLKDFKPEVQAWLTKRFGADVVPGNKAIHIRANGTRRDADVLVCAKVRRYQAGSTGTDYNYDEGICFFLPDSTRIINFPVQHADHCTTKHQATNQWFKPLVRIAKNMRNRMVDEGHLADGVAPSYFIEGMLWNVPNENFGGSYEDSFVNSLNWIIKTDQTKLACANDLFWLVRDNARNCWPTANFDTYIAAVKAYWASWGS